MTHYIRKLLEDGVFWPFALIALLMVFVAALMVFDAGFIAGGMAERHGAQARQARDCIALAESRGLPASFTSDGACVMGGVVVLEVTP